MFCLVFFLGKDQVRCVGNLVSYQYLRVGVINHALLKQTLLLDKMSL